MKKSVAIILSLILIVSILPFSVIAKEINRIDFTMGDEIEGGFLTYDASNGKAKSFNKYFGNFPLTGRYYDQLNQAQKEVYDALLASDISAQQVDVSFSTPVIVPGSDENWTPVSDVIFTAFFAFGKDHPERFWYNGARWRSNNGWYEGSDIAVGGATVGIVIHSSYSFSTVEDVYNQLMQKVNTFKPVGATRYEKLRSIHDYIINTATYDPNYDNSNAAPYGHQPTGCLLSPYLCVCEGYAEAFKIFADREGIPNMLVSSSGHIWNVVLMEDNKWYAIDCTWDDPMTGNSNYNNLRYSYFLVGSSTVPEGKSEAFSQESSHIEKSVYTDSTGKSLQNPPLNPTSYAPFYPKETWRLNGTQGNDYPGGSVYKDNLLVYLAPGKTVSNCFATSSSTGTVTSTGNATGSSLTFTPNSGASTSYTVIMHGDINRDASVNATDINYLTEMSTGVRSYPASSPESYAGDCNGDGVVDGFDLALLDRYQNGSYNFY